VECLREAVGDLAEATAFERKGLEKKQQIPFPAVVVQIRFRRHRCSRMPRRSANSGLLMYRSYEIGAFAGAWRVLLIQRLRFSCPEARDCASPSSFVRRPLLRRDRLLIAPGAIPSRALVDRWPLCASPSWRALALSPSVARAVRPNSSRLAIKRDSVGTCDRRIPVEKFCDTARYRPLR